MVKLKIKKVHLVDFNNNTFEGTYNVSEPPVPPSREVYLTESDPINSVFIEIIDYLQECSKRSNYQWSEGPEYNWYEYENEGKIKLATDILNKLNRSIYRKLEIT